MNGTRNTALIFIILCLSYFQSIGQDYVPGEVLIKMKPGKTMVQKNNIKHQMNANTKKTFSRSPLELWQINAPQTDIKAVVQQYKNHPDIEYIEPNYIFEIEEVIPDDRMFEYQWGLHNINATQAWTYANESPTIKVGIIDTGIDWAHEDLVDNIWQNLGEDADGDGKVIEWNGNQWVFDPGDENGIDDDANGYADDFVGWDFRNNDNNPFDGHSHGTHIAGIIGARGNNGIGVTGVTWNVQLAALKAFSDNGSANAADIQAAIQYSIMMQIPVTNNSWSSNYYSSPIGDATSEANDKGYLLIASAGNDGTDNDDLARFPASYDIDNIISVASIDESGALASTSNYGATSVDIAAPGDNIYSTVSGNQYGYKSGTSMAAPYVTGACALLWAQYPYKDGAEIKEAILNSAQANEYLEGQISNNRQLNLDNCLNYFDAEIAGCQSDIVALTALYYATGGHGWTNIWKLEKPLEEWHGVRLNDDGCVVAIDLSSNQLDGYIPPEIGYLTNLEELNLSNNQLTGNIPATLSDLTNLRILSLPFNQLAGSIPPEIGQLTNLTDLNLAINLLESEIPSEIYSLTNLIHLNLAVNYITDNISSEIENLANLESLNMIYTRIYGSLPAELGNLTNLTDLQLNDTNLSGCYPDNLLNLCGQLNNTGNISDNTELPRWTEFCANGDGTCAPCSQTDLSTLISIHNIATGAGWNSPWDITNPAMDQWYGVTLNQSGCVIGLNLTGTGITGDVLPEVSNLVNLEVLYLNNNNLKGEIPSQIQNLSNLEILDISNNELIDAIPVGIYNLSNLDYFNVANNILEGEIPADLGEMENLSYLNLSNNEISGYIPPELGNLSNLTSLLLNDNRLQGSIPAQLGNLSNLSIIDLSTNELGGCYHHHLANLCGQLDHDIRISQGNGFDIPWPDFCEDETLACPRPVWPGDMNANGTVEKEDLLYWGLAEGRDGGPVRSDQSTDWSPKECENWGTSTNQINNKHQDANGDGKIDNLDVDAIRDNYNQSYDFNLNTDIVQSNTQLTLDLTSETTDQTTNNIVQDYSLIASSLPGAGTFGVRGISCTIDFGSLPLESAELTIDGNNSDLAPPIMLISQYNSAQNRLEISVTRYSVTGPISLLQDVNIGTVQIIIDPVELDDGDTKTFSIGNGNMMDSNENLENVGGSTLYQDFSNDAFPVYANVTHANCSYWGSITLDIDNPLPYIVHWEHDATVTASEIYNLTPGVYNATIIDKIGKTVEVTVEVEGQYMTQYDEQGNPLECNPVEVTPPSNREAIDENSYLKQNHPNPFSKTTTIPYNIPEDAKNPVLNIFDVTGNLKYTTPVTQTGEGEIQISQHKLPTGIYYYQLKMDERISTTRKMIIVR